MHLNLFCPGDNVLLIGEGNFSFAVCLRKHNLPIQITATCFEPEICLESQQENIDFLESKEVPVYLDVDATKLHEHPHLTEFKYSKIIFNFPHVGGKMKIHLNRDLLMNTFKSAKHVMHRHGKMMVSLCRGQGGTPADEPQRRWDDSWQITEMAAHGDFVLIDVQPFCPEYYSEYKCVGYRSQDVEFDMTGALVHIFVKKTPVYPSIDETSVVTRLSLNPVCTKFGTVNVPILYAELYQMRPLNNKDSPVSFFKEVLLSEIENVINGERSMNMLSDEDISLHVSYKRGVMCKVNDVTNNCRLRLSSTQIFDQALLLWEKLTSDGLVFFPGVYFHPVGGKDFLTDPPVSYQFLLLGKHAATYSYRYISKLTKVFKNSNISCSLRPQSLFGEDVPLPEETVEDLNKFANIFRGKLATEWAYIYMDSSDTDKVVSHVYTLDFKDNTLDACIIYPDILAKVLFAATSWRELWSDGCKVTTGLVNEVEKPILKQIVLYPATYSFDITVRIKQKGFTEDKFYEVAWLAAGLLINNIELLNIYESPEGWSSHCYRVIYKSLDKPLYRSKVIDIQTNVLGRMLVKALKVTIA